MNTMHLWDKYILLIKLKNNTLGSSHMYFSALFGPLLTIIISSVFMILLYFYQFVETFFEDLMQVGQNPLLLHCHTFFIIMSGLTTFITIVGFSWCYIVNRKGDAKDFFIRISCLSLWINIHMLIFLLALCSILGIFGLFVLYKKVIFFHSQLQKTGVATAIVPFFIKSILAPLVGLQTSSLPPIVVRFFENTRTSLLFAYFIIGSLPAILSFIYYYSLARMLKIISNDSKNLNF